MTAKVQLKRNRLVFFFFIMFVFFFAGVVQLNILDVGLSWEAVAVRDHRELATDC